jgi:NADH-quinone oxidoreductase subunit M
VFAAIGTVLTAGYFLWLLQRVNLGSPRPLGRRAPRRRHAHRVGVLGAAAGADPRAGVYPKLVFGVQDAAVSNLMSFVTA